MWRENRIKKFYIYNVLIKLTTQPLNLDSKVFSKTLFVHHEILSLHKEKLFQDLTRHMYVFILKCLHYIILTINPCISSQAVSAVCSEPCAPARPGVTDPAQTVWSAFSARVSPQPLANFLRPPALCGDVWTLMSGPRTSVWSERGERLSTQTLHPPGNKTRE